MSNIISASYDQLVISIIALDDAWLSNEEHASLRHIESDIRHHICMLMARLDLRAYEALDGETRILAHEAYLAVLSLGQLLLRAVEEALARPRAIADTRAALDRVLDAMTPLVSRADDAMRRVLLENMPFETAVAEVGRGQ